MEKPPTYRLTDAEKDALIADQAALIQRLAGLGDGTGIAGRQAEEDVVEFAPATVHGWSRTQES